MHNERRIQVYEDPEDKRQVVYTTKQGLAICHRDEDKGFIELATYIDDSMLLRHPTFCQIRFVTIPIEVP